MPSRLAIDITRAASRTRRALACTLTIGAVALPSHGDVLQQLRFDITPYWAASGIREGDPRADLQAEGPGSLAPRYATVVTAPGANLLRVRFGDFDLQDASEIHLTSLADGAVQHFTGAMLREWGGWSAIFNGDAILVELLVASDETAHFEIDAVSINEPPNGEIVEGGLAGLCDGTDTRTPSADPRIGRLSSAGCPGGTRGCGGCTAWLTSIGSAMTAGHCGSGQGGVIEFQVPPSASNGAPAAASPNDQYPVGMNWYAFQNGGPGFDWAIMDVGPNSNTGVRAHWAQGYIHLSPVLPADGATLRVTGYGVDNIPAGSAPTQCCSTNAQGQCTHTGCNSASLTQQTAIGPKVGHSANVVEFEVDNEPATSGSPIIRTLNGFAIGINTHGGCEMPEFEYNTGNRLTQSVLAQWLQNFLGADTRFVDWAQVSPTQSGTAMNPAHTVPTGVNLAPVGGTVAIAGGNYAASSGNSGVYTKAVTLRAVSGNVTIGN